MRNIIAELTKPVQVAIKTFKTSSNLPDMQVQWSSRSDVWNTGMNQCRFDYVGCEGINRWIQEMSQRLEYKINTFHLDDAFLVDQDMIDE